MTIPSSTLLPCSAMHLARLCKNALITSLLCLTISGCATSGGSLTAPGSHAQGNSRITVCKATDTQVNSSSQCLQDDAACYELANGQWCTGERGNVCPAGSVALAAGATCPPGRRCFRVGESLECTIN